MDAGTFGAIGVRGGWGWGGHGRWGWQPFCLLVLDLVNVDGSEFLHPWMGVTKPMGWIIGVGAFVVTYGGGQNGI